MAKRKDKLAELLAKYSEEEIREICAASTSRTDFIEHLIIDESDFEMIRDYIINHMQIGLNYSLLLLYDFNLSKIQSFLNHKSKDDLQLLISRGLSILQIAKFLNCGKTTIQYWFHKHNLKSPYKSFSEGYTNQFQCESISCDELESCIRQLQFSSEIASLYQMSTKQIERLITKYDLRALYRSLYSQRIHQRYDHKEWTDEELAIAVQNNNTYIGVLRTFGYSKGNTALIKKLKIDINRLNLDISHFVRVDPSFKHNIEQQFQSKFNCPNFGYIDPRIDNKTVGIYLIKNKITQLVYVGQSRRMLDRIHDHRYKAYSINSKSYYSKLETGIRNYGTENFEVFLLEECQEHELDKKERFYIEYFNSFNNGYNATRGGTNFMPTKVELRHRQMEQIPNIVKDLSQTNLTQKEIALQRGVSSHFVSDVNKGLFDKNYPCSYPIRPLKKHTKMKKEIREKTEQKSKSTDRQVKSKKKTKKQIKTQGQNSSLRKQSPLNEQITRDQLQQLIFTTSFEEIGKMFGVSGSAIRKLCESFGLPKSRTLIQLLSSDEYEIICSSKHDNDFYQQLLQKKEKAIVSLYKFGAPTLFVQENIHNA